MAIRTNENDIPFGKVVNSILQRDGVDTELVGLASDLVSYINDKVEQAWGHEFWPQTMRCAKRNFYDIYCAGQTYDIGDILWSGSAYVICVTDGTQENPNTAMQTSWQPITNTGLESKIIPLWQNGPDILDAGTDVIYRVKGISMRNPKYKGIPGYLKHSLHNDSIHVSSLAPDEVFVEYQVEPPVFTLDEIYDDVGYMPRIPLGPTARQADILYDPETKHCYEALQNATSADLYTDDTHWKRIPFPKFLQRYVVHASYSEWLASEGQNAKSELEAENAEKILYDLMDTHAPHENEVEQATYIRR